MTDRRRALRLFSAALAVQAAGAAALAYGVLRLRLIDPAGLTEGFLGHRYASLMVGGAWPYRDFPVEYPALVLPVMLLPRLVAAGVLNYYVAFGVEMLLFQAATLALLAGWVRRREGAGAVPGRLAWAVAAFVALCPLAVVRFDAAATALAFGAACAWATGRNARGGVLAGLGVLMKLFPGLVALPALADEVAGFRRTRGRGLAALGLTVLGGGAAWVALGGPAGVGRSFGYHLERPPEVGSLYAGAVMAMERAVGVGVEVAFGHASVETVGPVPDRLARLALPLQAAALLALLAAYVRSGRREPLRYAGAAILAFVAFGKVLSPQYLLWLLPFVVALEGRAGRLARPVFLAACGLTTLLYPVAFGALIAMHPAAVAVLNVRNALLLILLGLMGFGPVGRPEAAGPRRSGALDLSDGDRDEATPPGRTRRPGASRRGGRPVAAGGEPTRHPA